MEKERHGTNWFVRHPQITAFALGVCIPLIYAFFWIYQVSHR